MSATTRLAAATVGRRPFTNGTEGDAWAWAWCNHCAADHSMHGNDPDGSDACGIMLEAVMDLPNGWPEAWLPEPDDGSFALPSRMVCLAFQPCGECGGDPGAEDRAERVAEVTAYWREHGHEQVTR